MAKEHKGKGDYTIQRGVLNFLHRNTTYRINTKDYME